MIKKIGQKFSLVMLMATSFLMIFSPYAYAVALNSIYVSPATKSVTPGTVFNVSVDANVGAYWLGASQVYGTMTFTPSRLKVLSVSTTGSPYQMNTATPDNNAGQISFTESNYWGGPTNETIHIMTVTFQALALGTGNVGFAAGTTFNTGETSLAGGVYTIASPPPPAPPPPPPTPPPTPTPTPTPTPSPTPTPVPTPVPPVVPIVITPPQVPEAPPVQVDAGDLSIEKVNVVSDWEANTVAWSTTLKGTDSELLIGTTEDRLSIKPTVTKNPDGTFVSNVPDLDAGTRYFYTINSSLTLTPDKKATYSGTFKTRGYPVKVVVTQAKKPVAGARIELEKEIYKADKNGEIGLELAAKSYDLGITLPDNSTKAASFRVEKKPLEKSGNPPVQKFSYDLPALKIQPKADSSPIPVWAMVAAGVGGAVMLGLGALLVARRRSALSGGTGAVVIDEGGYDGEYEAPDPAQQQAYDTPEDQQYTDLTSVEQQYVPETEQVDAYTQPVAPEQTYQPVEQAYDQPEEQPQQQAPAAEPVYAEEVAAAPAEVAYTAEVPLAAEQVPDVYVQPAPEPQPPVAVENPPIELPLSEAPDQDSPVLEISHMREMLPTETIVGAPKEAPGL